MRTVKWSPQAQSDLAAIDLYYRNRDPSYSYRIGIQAIRTGEFLASHPEGGEQVMGGPRRKWRTAGTPYIILYRPTRTELRIVRVIHVARDWTRFV